MGHGFGRSSKDLNYSVNFLDSGETKITISQNKLLSKRAVMGLIDRIRNDLRKTWYQSRGK
jgi:hypothetical protein